VTDIHDKKTRSYNMSKIKGGNTKPELLIRKFLHGQGFRFKIHDKTLPGKPDIVLPKYGTIIFVHGCFWHGHKNCKYAQLPASNTKWWTNKICENISRDKKAIIRLKLDKWEVITIWTCRLKSKKFDATQKLLIKKLVNES
jgi:DNA mismatch endonuclease, patch repair protein